MSSMLWKVRWTFVSRANSSVGTQSCATPPGRSAGLPDPTRPWYVRVLGSTGRFCQIAPVPHSCMCACAKETSSFWPVQKHPYWLLTECCKQISRSGLTDDSIYLFRPTQFNPKLLSGWFLKCFRVLSGLFVSFRVLWILPDPFGFFRVCSSPFQILSGPFESSVLPFLGKSVNVIKSINIEI